MTSAHPHLPCIGCTLGNLGVQQTIPSGGKSTRRHFLWPNIRHPSCQRVFILGTRLDLGLCKPAVTCLKQACGGWFEPADLLYRLLPSSLHFLSRQKELWISKCKCLIVELNSPFISQLWLWKDFSNGFILIKLNRNIQIWRHDKKKIKFMTFWFNSKLFLLS